MAGNCWLLLYCEEFRFIHKYMVRWIRNSIAVYSNRENTPSTTNYRYLISIVTTLCLFMTKLMFGYLLRDHYQLWSMRRRNHCWVRSRNQPGEAQETQQQIPQMIYIRYYFIEPNKLINKLTNIFNTIQSFINIDGYQLTLTFLWGLP